ncbi:MAG: hypothetical protein A2W98_05185 [Bacteroidetes bacterium GWF2_33_38]|nr:MAG: hypothetical protein A2W98_05185 [Bacteroidetes bacterium GWF2_33_38]OFY68155.1 MAG: hypothetical protein A2265_06810 [Bacteroidetes bacterium RIFOXYA12_FULL_33_9]OFY86862.1 MAG: hypothetical protein A2236_12510 [Bacteroidetes bacterium RIFOXYA2_FULL_33_7]HBX51754.1 hypothetical protein [Bacteroidales bacterium]
MKIKDLSISDLKAAYDFVLLDLKDLEESAKREKVPVEKIPAYSEVKEVENKLWHELLNITRLLK